MKIDRKGKKKHFPFLIGNPSIRHLLSLTTTTHNYVDARAYTSGQIITVAAAVYHGEDSIVFCIVCF